MIFNLIDKRILLSDEKFHKKNISFVKKTLLSNSYPVKFTDKFVKIKINKLKYKNSPKNESSKNTENKERIV